MGYTGMQFGIKDREQLKWIGILIAENVDEAIAAMEKLCKRLREQKPVQF